MKVGLPALDLCGPPVARRLCEDVAHVFDCRDCADGSLAVQKKGVVCAVGFDKEDLA